MNRRAFVSLLAAGVALAASSRSRAQSTPTSGRRRVGLIGCGWYGGVNLLRLAQIEPIDVVSLCDVDRAALATTQELVGTLQSTKPKTFADYSDMLAAGRLKRSATIG